MKLPVARRSAQRRDQAPLWDSPLGQQVNALERQVLAPLIRRFHGDTALWIGAEPHSAELLSHCMVRHSVIVQPALPAAATTTASEPSGEGPPATDSKSSASRPALPEVSEERMPRLVAQIDHLPFKSGSMDAVVLHHALESAADPRVGLREVTRVLAPGGRLVIVGFNPMSLIGLRRIYARVFADVLSRHKCVNPMRLFDWLTVLGLELEQPPQYHASWMPLLDIDLETVTRGCDDAQAYQSAIAPPEGASPRPAEGAPRCASRLPFGCIMSLSAVKQTTSGRLPRITLPKRARLAPVAYPRVASWRRSDS